MRASQQVGVDVFKLCSSLFLSPLSVLLSLSLSLSLSLFRGQPLPHTPADNSPRRPATPFRRVPDRPQVIY